MKILIGGAWPYANGSLHIGHLAALLPGDIIARYYRLKGDDVYYVSGSDCHGTPVAIRAREEKKLPSEVSDYYHEEFLSCFNKLGFSYDRYGKTSSEEHKEFVKEFHKKLYKSKYVYEKSIPQAFCDHCNMFLADRFVNGKCPNCGEDARGDQCDACGKVLDPEMLVEPKCAICGNTPIFKESTNLYINISDMEKEITEFVESHPEWRKNAISLSKRYIKEGLQNRAITRDLEWGIDVPKEGYENKKIYIWAENVLGYLSMSDYLAKERNEDFYEIWGENSKHYYVHGKDNIPFHTIILPSLIIAEGENLHLPDEIISSEYLTLEGRKISTSRNWAIWVKDIVDKYDPDSIRYFLTTNGPEKRDTDFSWREFVNSHNSELLGAYGNFVNRSLVFVNKYFDGAVPKGKINEEIKNKISNLYNSVGSKIEKGFLKEAIDEIFEFVRYSNKFFDSEKPWETRNSDIDKCKNTLYNCVQIIANLAILLEPFIPFSSKKVQKMLSLPSKWEEYYVEPGSKINETCILFERLDKSVIDEELKILNNMN